MNQDSDTPSSKPSSPTSDDGSSFDDDFIDVGNNENTNDAYCVVANQSGSRVGVGHSGGFKLFEVKKVVMRGDSTKPASSAPSPPVPPYQLVELFRFEGFSGSGVGGGVGTGGTTRIGGKGIGQMALLHDTMFVGAVGAGPHPAASPNVVLLFSRSTLESTLEYPAAVTRLMISRDMVFTLTSDQFFTIRTFKGATLMRVSTHTLNTPADQPLAIDSYRNFIAYPDAKIGSFSVANFADPKNIRIVCQNRAAHHHTLTGLALGQATLATPATSKATPTPHRHDTSASSSSAADSSSSYEATVCVTCSLHGTLVRVWDVTEDANPFPTTPSKNGAGGGRFAGIMLCELRASTAPCHIRHLGLNKRSYLYVLMANELKIFFIGKTEKRKPSDVSLTTAEQITNKESLLKRLDFVSSYFASQWAACSVGLPSGGLFLPPWAPKGKIKCLERVVAARHGSGGSHRGASNKKKDDDHHHNGGPEDSTSSISSFFRGTYAQWITPETADAARDAVKHSTTAALAALATAFSYASNTSVVRAAMTGELSDRFYRTLPPLPSGEPRPEHAGGSQEDAPVLHGVPTPSPVPAGVAEGGATWTSGLHSLWSYTSSSAAAYTSPTGGNPDVQTGGAVQFPAIPGVHYDPSLSGKQLDDLVCLWWESEQAMDLRRSVEWGDEDVTRYTEFQQQQDVDLREVYVAKPAWVKVSTTPAMTSTVEEDINSDNDDTNSNHRRNNNNETSDSDTDGGTPCVRKPQVAETTSATPPSATSTQAQDHHLHHTKHGVIDKHGTLKPQQPLFGDPSVLYDNSSSSVAAVASAGGHPLSTTSSTSNVDFIWSANANGDLIRVGFRPLGGKLTVHRVVPAKTL